MARFRSRYTLDGDLTTPELADKLNISAASVRKYFYSSGYFTARYSINRECHLYDFDEILEQLAEYKILGTMSSALMRKIPETIWHKVQPILVKLKPRVLEQAWLEKVRAAAHRARNRVLKEKVAVHDGVFLVESVSRPAHFHRVEILPHSNAEYVGHAVCQCPGFQARGDCKHVGAVWHLKYDDLVPGVIKLIWDRDYGGYNAL